MENSNNHYSLFRRTRIIVATSSPHNHNRARLLLLRADDAAPLPLPGRLARFGPSSALHNSITMAAAPPPRDPKLDTAGAPVNLPAQYERAWLDWFDAKSNIVFEHVEDRLVLKPGAKHLITYAPFLDLFVGPGEELFAKCIIQGCDSEASKEGKGIRLTYPKLNMNNVIDHFMRSHGGVFVTALDYKQRAGAIAAKAPAASDARKRARGSGRGEDGGGGRSPRGRRTRSTRPTRSGRASCWTASSRRTTRTPRRRRRPWTPSGRCSPCSRRRL